VKPRFEDRLAAGGAGIELLRLPAALFGLAAAVRGAAYDRGLLPVAHLDAPVVGVGNLTAGGTGKTPLVAWLVEWFRARGARPGVLSRGYGAGRGAHGRPLAGDEARMLAAALPELPAVQDRDRVRGGRELLRRGVDLVVLDDGFQHRRLYRDRDLVLVDATRPFGLPYGPGAQAPRHFLPRGLLRESPRALRRADVIVLSRCDQADPARLARLESELQRWAPGAPLVRTSHRPRGLRALADGERYGLERLRDREVDLVSGIGHPEAFERTVLALGARLREHRRFRDHHEYRAEELRGLGAGGCAVVTTAKDGVKLAALLPAALSLDVILDFETGREALEASLETLWPGAAERARRALHGGLHG
jgi:tetraacyldisaccharide 4'-kinase